jgi:hypothetical protein
MSVVGVRPHLGLATLLLKVKNFSLLTILLGAQMLHVMHNFIFKYMQFLCCRKFVYN